VDGGGEREEGGIGCWMASGAVMCMVPSLGPLVLKPLLSLLSLLLLIFILLLLILLLLILLLLALLSRPSARLFSLITSLFISIVGGKGAGGVMDSTSAGEADRNVEGMLATR